MLADFHFLRPLWLLALLLVPLLCWIARNRHGDDSGWSRIMPAHLLKPLMRSTRESMSTSRSRLPVLVLFLTLLPIALAGPTWREQPTPLQQQNDSLVIALDLSLSMLATDVNPDRLTQAKRKVRDILETRQNSYTALVVYSADAHVVTPLTDDSRTITSLLDTLTPLIMPDQGNRADRAVAEAVSLLQQGGRGDGRILLVTDAVSTTNVERIREFMADSPYTVSTLAVGTTEGGPMPIPDRGYISEGGQPIISHANPQGLAELAESLGGFSATLTLDNTDVRELKLRTEDQSQWKVSERGLETQRWQDDGYWLMWLLVPLMLLCWRQSSLLAVALVIYTALPRPAAAFDWQSLWERPEQRGAELIEQDPAGAARQFDDPQWKGSALYRAGEYEQAAADFAQADTADAHYNRGNALARQGKLAESISAYERALELDPDSKDAAANKQLVEDLQKQQEQEKQQQQDSDDSQNQEGQDGQDGQNGQNNQNGDSQNGEQNGSDSQSQSNDSEGDSQGDQSSGGSDSNQSSSQQNGGNGGDESTDSMQSGESPEMSDPAQGQKDGDQQADSQEQPGSGAETQQPPPGEGQESEGLAGSESDTENPLNQSQEQWLRRIPDDPGGLLRRKFLQQYRDRDRQQDTSDTPW